MTLAAALAAACSSSSSRPAGTGDGGNQASEAGSDAAGAAEASTESGASDAAADRAATHCTSNADCGGGVCGFPTASGCSATGTCYPAPGAVCQAYSAGCACDGTTVNVICNGLPLGNTPKPLLHSGDCTSDAGPG